MCLIAKHHSPKIVKQDITVYKMVRYVKNVNEYETPYACTYIPKYVINGSKPFEARGKVMVTNPMPKLYRVFGGYIHSYASLRQAAFAASTENLAVFRCRIPRGTEYYEGDNEYASKKIIFEKKIPNIFTKIAGFLFGFNF